MKTVGGKTVVGIFEHDLYQFYSRRVIFTGGSEVMIFGIVFDMIGAANLIQGLLTDGLTLIYRVTMSRISLKRKGLIRNSSAPSCFAIERSWA